MAGTCSFPRCLTACRHTRKLSTPSHGTTYSRQALALELCMVGVFILLSVKFHNGAHLTAAIIYVSLLFEMAVIDLHHRLVLNVLSIPAPRSLF